MTLPDELKDCLRESNGIKYNYGAGLIWSTAEIKKNNLEFRADPDYKRMYMPFDCLLFFGDYGNGDQAAYPIVGGEINRRGYIFEWNHEDDSRTWTAANLQQYIKARLKKE